MFFYAKYCTVSKLSWLLDLATHCIRRWWRIITRTSRRWWSDESAKTLISQGTLLLTVKREVIKWVERCSSTGHYIVSAHGGTLLYSKPQQPVVCLGWYDMLWCIWSVLVFCTMLLNGWYLINMYSWISIKNKI